MSTYITYTIDRAQLGEDGKLEFNIGGFTWLLEGTGSSSTEEQA